MKGSAGTAEKREDQKSLKQRLIDQMSDWKEDVEHAWDSATSSVSPRQNQTTGHPSQAQGKGKGLGKDAGDDPARHDFPIRPRRSVVRVWIQLFALILFVFGIVHVFRRSENKKQVLPSNEDTLDEWKKAFYESLGYMEDRAKIEARSVNHNAKANAQDAAGYASSKFEEWKEALQQSGKDWKDAIQEQYNKLSPSNSFTSSSSSFSEDTWKKFEEWKRQVASTGKDWRDELTEMIGRASDQVKSKTTKTETPEVTKAFNEWVRSMTGGKDQESWKEYFMNMLDRAENAGQKTGTTLQESVSNRLESWKNSLLEKKQDWKEALENAVSSAESKAKETSKCTESSFEDATGKFEEWKKALKKEGKDWKSTLDSKMAENSPSISRESAEYKFDQWKRAIEAKGEDWRDVVLSKLQGARSAARHSSNSATDAYQDWKIYLEKKGEDWKTTLDNTLSSKKSSFLW